MNIFIITCIANGRHGMYGSTVSVVGACRTMEKAKVIRKEFLADYNFNQIPYCKLSMDNVTIQSIEVGRIDEAIVAKIYE